MVGGGLVGAERVFELPPMKSLMRSLSYLRMRRGQWVEPVQQMNKFSTPNDPSRISGI